MGKHLRHPEARIALAQERAAARNEVIRRRCATPGFGYVVLLYKWDGSRHTRHTETYLEAAEVRNEDMASGDYDKAWIIEKDWNAAMSITDDPRDHERLLERWRRSQEDIDL